MAHLVELEKIATDVTSEQMSKCCKVISFQVNEDFYQVESSDGTTDYEVHYDPEHGFTCTCEAGQHGFAHCKNFCWHVRASVACFLEEEAYKQELDEKAAQGLHPLEHKAVRIEDSVPAWILKRPVAPHMSKSPREQ